MILTDGTTLQKTRLKEETYCATEETPHGIRRECRLLNFHHVKTLDGLALHDYSEVEYQE